MLRLPNGTINAVKSGLTYTQVIQYTLADTNRPVKPFYR